jgi:hypothetical protein
MSTPFRIIDDLSRYRWELSRIRGVTEQQAKMLAFECNRVARKVERIAQRGNLKPRTTMSGCMHGPSVVTKAALRAAP